MTIETIDSEVAHVLETIATQLGIAAEHVFGVFVDAQMMIGIIDIVSIFTVIIGTLLVGKYVRKMVIIDNGEDPTEDEKAAAFWVPCFVAFIALFMIGGLMGAIGDALLKIACPEYTAVKEIISIVKP